MNIGKIGPCFMEERIHRIVPLYGGLGGSDRPKVQDTTSLCSLENSEVGELWGVF